MQDHSGRLRKDRKGIMSLPIKLMVIMIVISLSVPLLTNALNDSQESMAGAEMSHQAEKFKNAAVLAHYSGNGCSRTVELELPQGCEMSVGGKGNDAFTIRLLYNGEIVSKEYFDKPVLKIDQEMTFTGKVTLKLTSVETGGTPGIKVTVL